MSFFAIFKRDWGKLAISDVIRDWFSHTADLVVEHVDEPDGRVRIYFLSSMADLKIVYTTVYGGTANPENVQTIRQRIRDLEVDGLVEVNILAQFITDNGMSVFPTLLQTERPDRVSSSLRKGQVAILMQGSPFVLLGPTALIHFFESPDDYYFRWSIGTFNRVLRVSAMIASLLFTPLYVAALTFHYEMIPADLLLSLASLGPESHFRRCLRL
ncbi:spore germination protein [Brevibacillus borstelensis]